MALQCSVSAGELGLPTTTPVLALPVDYSNGYSTFAKTFVETARDLCPVRTGYLRSTIGCEVTADGVVCTAGASYAEYVEYGSWNTPARPFMEPALEAASAAAAPECQQTYDEALLEEQQTLNAIGGRINEEIAGGAIADGLKSGGGLFGMLLNIFITIVIGIIMEFVKDIFSYDQGEGIFNSLYSSGFSPIVDVIDGNVEVDEYDEEGESEEW